MVWQSGPPIYVTIAAEPTPTESAATTVAGIILGSLGLVGALLIASVLLGAAIAFLLVRWHQQHPPETAHPPPVSPLVAGSDTGPTSPVR